jgi:hypothetical protein
MQAGAVVLLVFADLRLRGEGVAFELEFSAERIELRRSIVAG